MPVDERGPSAHEEWKTAPDHDRSSQRKLQPLHGARGQFVQKTIKGHSAHGKRKQRNAESYSNPESALHAAEFVVIFFMDAGGDARLKSHSADGAVPWMVTDNFRVHGAGVFNCFRL